MPERCVLLAAFCKVVEQFFFVGRAHRTQCRFRSDPAARLQRPHPIVFKCKGLCVVACFCWVWVCLVTSPKWRVTMHVSYHVTGAGDDASNVGVMLELANNLVSSKQLPPTPTIFFFSGAEEPLCQVRVCGLVGRGLHLTRYCIQCSPVLLHESIVSVLSPITLCLCMYVVSDRMLKFVFFICSLRVRSWLTANGLIVLVCSSTWSPSALGVCPLCSSTQAHGRYKHMPGVRHIQEELSQHRYCSTMATYIALCLHK